jgi:calcineurin-like phosphoesterase family protein
MKTGYERALSIFQQTLDGELRVSTAINLGLMKMIDKDLIVATSQMVKDDLDWHKKVWLTSDHHFGHLNIISYSDRPFHGLTDMTDTHVNQLNKIAPDDLVIFAGDMIMGNFQRGVECIQSCNGRKILVAGNHDFDRDGKCKLVREKDLFEAVVPFLFWETGLGRMVIVTHYPIICGVHDTDRTVINYHGHLHLKTVESTDWVKYINVGWDQTHGLVCL